MHILKKNNIYYYQNAQKGYCYFVITEVKNHRYRVKILHEKSPLTWDNASHGGLLYSSCPFLENCIKIC